MGKGLTFSTCTSERAQVPLGPWRPCVVVHLCSARLQACMHGRRSHCPAPGLCGSALCSVQLCSCARSRQGMRGFARTASLGCGVCSSPCTQPVQQYSGAHSQAAVCPGPRTQRALWCQGFGQQSAARTRAGHFSEGASSLPLGVSASHSKEGCSPGHDTTQHKRGRKMTQPALCRVRVHANTSETQLRRQRLCKLPARAHGAARPSNSQTAEPL